MPGAQESRKLQPVSVRACFKYSASAQWHPRGNPKNMRSSFHEWHHKKQNRRSYGKPLSGAGRYFTAAFLEEVYYVCYIGELLATLYVWISLPPKLMRVRRGVRPSTGTLQNKAWRQTEHGAPDSPRPVHVVRRLQSSQHECRPGGQPRFRHIACGIP